eukprot:8984955-Alexandrium_andersonii.AAC.1
MGCSQPRMRASTDSCQSNRAVAPLPTHRRTRPRAGWASAERTTRGSLRWYPPNPRTPRVRGRLPA